MRREALEFLLLAEGTDAGRAQLFDDQAMQDEGLAQLVKLYQVADTLSVDAANTYRRALGAMVVVSTIITVAFLLYDEAEIWGLILVVGLMLLCGELISRFALRSCCHERYVKMRVLAECLRVEAYMHYAGCQTRVAEILPWSMKQDLDWVEDVLLEWEGRNPLPPDSHDVRECWLEGQRSYHAQAIASAAQRYAASQRVVRGAARVSAVIYVLTLLFELVCGGWAMPVLVPVADLEFWRAALKITLGTVSASTVFVGGYFQKLSLGRVLDDHRKMERLYAEALGRMSRKGQTCDFLCGLAREELMENGNWYAFQKDSELELIL